MKMRLACISLAFALLSTRTAHAAEPTPADTPMVVIISSDSDEISGRIAAELQSAGISVSTRSATPGAVERILRENGASDDDVVIRVMNDRIEIWLVRGDGLHFAEGLTRGNGSHDDEDASLQSAERVRARFLFAPRHRVVRMSEPDARPPGGRIETVASLGVMFTPSFGGDPSAACGRSCSSPVGVGERFAASVGFRARSGWGAALEAGYGSMTKSYLGRSASAEPVGFESNLGTSNDSITLEGPTAGATVSWQRGARVRGSVAVGAGIMAAKWSSVREATLSTSGGTTYVTSGLTERSSMFAPYVAPEARVSYRVWDTVSMHVGLRAMAMFGLDRARSEGTSQFHAGTCPNMDSNACQGLAHLRSESVFASAIVAGGPFAGATAEF